MLAAENAAAAIETALGEKDLATANAQLKTIEQACSACHGKYRNTKPAPAQQ